MNKALSIAEKISGGGVTVVAWIFFLFWINPLCQSVVQIKYYLPVLQTNSILLIVLVYILLLFGVAWLITFPSIINCNKVLFWSILISIVIGISLLSVLYIDNVSTNDFRGYVAQGQQALKLNSWEAINSRLHNVYFKRALFFVYPVFLIWGNNHFYIELNNILLHILIGVNIYWMSKQWTKKETVARCSVIFYFLIPAQYVVLNLATHEFIGLLLLLLIINISSKIMHCLLLAKLISRRCLWYILPALLLGVLWFLLDAIRISSSFVGGLSIIWLLGQTFIVLRRYYSKRLVKRYLLIWTYIVIIPLLFLISVKPIFISSEQSMHKSKFIWILAKNYPPGFYPTVRENFLLIPDSKIREYAIGTILSYGLNNTRRFCRHLTLKNTHLGQLVDMGEAYVFSGAKKKRDYSHLKQALKPMGHILKLFFVSFLLIYIFKMSNKIRWRDPVFYGLWLSTVYVIFLVFIGEVISRYITLLLGFISLFVALGFAKCQEKTAPVDKRVNIRRTRMWLLLFFVFIIFCSSCIFIAKTLLPSGLYPMLTFKDVKAEFISGADKAKLLKLSQKRMFNFKFSKLSKEKKETYKFSWALKDLTVDKQYSLEGFLEMPENPAQITEIIINDKIIFNSTTDYTRFKWQKHRIQKPTSFLYGLKFIAKTNNVLTIKLIKPSNKNKVNLYVRAYGWNINDVCKYKYGK